MELPLDHFRLIGVSPSASTEEVLRAFQLKLDKTPDDGFTYEVLTQRSELLRLTADLLTDLESRNQYERLVLKGASGLDISSNREVAGLILLWESGLPNEAFKLARKALQPPQTPALGSSREADLTLLAGLTSRDAAIKEQQQRRYSNAAEYLQEGIQILQRMGKLGDLRNSLEEDLIALLPFRILDLVSRDLSDYDSHKKGLNMLENLIIKRGGIEGNNKSEFNKFLNQDQFEVFFQQIKPYLTVQEQIDLFLELYKRGSVEAGFLAFLSLTAIGFVRRKPEKLFESRKILKNLNVPGLDSMPLLGCIDLLLADVNQAEARFKSSSDENLNEWFQKYPGDNLEAICVYCKNWLENDVLVGFRDIDLEIVDLEAWFEDREIQEFIEKIEKKLTINIGKASFQNFIQKRANVSGGSNISDDKKVDDTKLPLPGGVREGEDDISEPEPNEISLSTKPIAFYKSIAEKYAEFKFSIGELLENKKLFNRSPYLAYLSAFLVLFGFGIGVGLLRTQLNKKNIEQNVLNISKIDDKKTVTKIDRKPIKNNINSSKTIDLNLNAKNSIKNIESITSPSPSISEITYLIDTWLLNKSDYLAGNSKLDLDKLVKKDLLNRLIKERQDDIQKNILKEIETEIMNVKILSQTASRIAVSVELNYLERITDLNGKLINETSFSPFLKVKYILGFSNKSWKLVDYISGV